MIWEVHGIFVAINFHTFFVAIVLVCECSEATWVNGPHVLFCLAFNDPFSQHFTSAASLANAKGEDARFKRVFNA